jgi:SAM-dependent methyltransferase
MVRRLYEATWGRGFAAYYDRRYKASERYGLEDLRRELLAVAAGKVMELGAGTGANLASYPDTIKDLTLIEPDPYMARRLKSRLLESGRAAEVLELPGEGLPFESDSFDTVVSTLALCTVPMPCMVLAEVCRVLRPEGQFLFLEHVRSEDPMMARWQDRLEKPWRFLADGCYCNRDTIGAIKRSELEIRVLRRSRLPKSPAIVRPLVVGTAVLPIGSVLQPKPRYRYPDFEFEYAR